MSEQSEQAQTYVDAAAESLSKLPASQPAEYTANKRFLTKDKTVHQLLGGGRAADSALWKDKYLSAGTLVGSTAIWFLLEKSGYTFLTLLCNILMFGVVILFVWENVANLLGRTRPNVPQLFLSEDFVLSTASAVRVEMNKALGVAREVALGKDFKLFLKVIAWLWVVSTVSSWFNFLTCVWIGILLLHVVPFVYDKYEDVINHHARNVADIANAQFKKLDDAVLSKIPRAPAKQKKVL